MKRILAVDDDRAILDSLDIALSDEGYDVLRAHDKYTLYQQIRQNPDLVLLDIRLGQDNGTRLAEELKENTETRHIPVILISANLDAYLPKNSSAAAFLPKPFDLSSLTRLIQKYVV